MNESVTVYTATSTFGYAPKHEDGATNPGEIKRVASLIEAEYPDTYEPDALVKALTDAQPDSVVYFEGGKELAAAQEAEAAAAEQAVTARTAALALAAESPEDCKSREFHEATKAKLEERGYTQEARATPVSPDQQVPANEPVSRGEPLSGSPPSMRGPCSLHIGAALNPPEETS